EFLAGCIRSSSVPAKEKALYLVHDIKHLSLLKAIVHALHDAAPGVRKGALSALRRYDPRTRCQKSVLKAVLSLIDDEVEEVAAYAADELTEVAMTDAALVPRIIALVDHRHAG